MACLEFCKFSPWEGSEAPQGLLWLPAKRKSVADLPQLFWSNGIGWHEANQWALYRACLPGVDAKTVLSQMRHLHGYATFLESTGIDWRHFPTRMDERCLIRFRGSLIHRANAGEIAISTARARMTAVIAFYRFANTHHLVEAVGPMWVDRTVVIPFFDSMGFKRSISRTTTNLHIPLRSRIATRLEDGLTPLSSTQLPKLRAFLQQSQSAELRLMLEIGFFTGARVGTIVSLHRRAINRARPSPLAPECRLVPVGPGTGIETKFGVKGDLLFPTKLLDELRDFGESTERLKRQICARPEDRDLLFLTRSGNKYSVNSVDRLVQRMRESAVSYGLDFMQGFKFHQSRATYGTQFLQILLSVMSTAAALEFLREAMLHKNVSTTLLYSKYLEVSKAKEAVADAFNKFFTGLTDKNPDAKDV